MKILFVQDSLGTGGAERSNAHLWYFLRDQAIDFKIVVLEHRKVGIEKEVLEAGMDVSFLQSGNFVTQLFELHRIIEDYKPDIVHSVLFRSAMRVRMVRLFKTFVHVESLVNCTYDPVRFRDPRVNKNLLKLYRALDKATAKKGTDYFLAISGEVKNHYKAVIGINDQKIDVIYRGRASNTPSSSTAADTRASVRREFGLPLEEFICIHVGRQEFQKDHLTLLKAIKSVDEKLADKVTFVMCGREGNASSAITKFLTENFIRTQIIWTGHRHDVPRLLAAADLFVFPSLYEGLGGSVIEAQAAALPIVCSALPVFTEVLGNSAVMFPPTSEHALAARLVEVVNDSTRLEQLRTLSRENFDKKFQIDSIHRLILSYYQKIAT
jgi:glycosyltransferase involved in cell wall biosynthesis